MGRITSNAAVIVGQQLGVHIGNGSHSDITIVNRSAFGNEARYVSLFNLLDDNGLLMFQRRNISNRTYPVIGSLLRKLHPLNCSGNGHIVNDSNWMAYPNWLSLNTTSPTERRRRQALRQKELKLISSLSYGDEFY